MGAGQCNNHGCNISLYTPTESAISFPLMCSLLSAKIGVCTIKINTYTHMQAHTYACMHKHTHTHTHIHARTHAHLRSRLELSYVHVYMFPLLSKHNFIIFLNKCFGGQIWASSCILNFCTTMLYMHMHRK